MHKIRFAENCHAATTWARSCKKKSRLFKVPLHMKRPSGRSVEADSSFPAVLSALSFFCLYLKKKKKKSVRVLIWVLFMAISLLVLPPPQEPVMHAFVHVSAQAGSTLVV